MHSLNENSLNICLSHIAEDDFSQEKAYEALIEIPGLPRNANIRFELVSDVFTTDVRYVGLEKFSLEEIGFQYVEHEFRNELNGQLLRDKLQGELAVNLFLQELRDLLYDVLEADKVILYDWRFRSFRGKLRDVRDTVSDRSAMLPPAAHVHADESAACGLKVVHEHISPDEQQQMATGGWRVRIMNVWKPLVSVVLDNPLALCDWRTVRTEDWELCDQIQADRCDEAMYLKHRGRHKWYWLHEQKQQELSLFTVWDSSKIGNGAQASVPHAAFHLPNESATRESIEIRTIIWHKT